MSKRFIEWSTDSIAIGRPGTDPTRTIGVTKYGSRQNPTLSVHHPTWTGALAYFKNDEAAREFCAIMGLHITEHGEPL